MDWSFQLLTCNLYVCVKNILSIYWCSKIRLKLFLPERERERLRSTINWKTNDCWAKKNRGREREREVSVSRPLNRQMVTWETDRESWCWLFFFKWLINIQSSIICCSTLVSLSTPPPVCPPGSPLLQPFVHPSLHPSNPSVVRQPADCKYVFTDFQRKSSFHSVFIQLQPQ